MKYASAAALRDALDRSPIREHKLHFQRFLRGPGHALSALAKAGGEAESAVDADARAAVALEVYLPVAAHREAWRGGADILVATAREDREAPVAFDVRGRRRLLSPDAPPDSPVLAVVPVETDFDAATVGFLLPDDGGASGRPVNAEKSLEEYLTRGEDIVQLDFVDDEYGWAIARDRDHLTQLLKTTDGGRTWNATKRKMQQ